MPLLILSTMPLLIVNTMPLLVVKTMPLFIVNTVPFVTVDTWLSVCGLWCLCCTDHEKVSRWDVTQTRTSQGQRIWNEGYVDCNKHPEAIARQGWPEVLVCSPETGQNLLGWVKAMIQSSTGLMKFPSICCHLPTGRISVIWWEWGLVRKFAAKTGIWTHNFSVQNPVSMADLLC